ncbi:MAG: AraC family transcriptional regulator [Thermodesulfobacteriota bacterium]
MQRTTSVGLIQMVLKFVEESGIDPRVLLEETGIASGILDDPDARIAVARVDALWAAAVAGTRDPHFGLHLGESMRNRPGGNLLFAIFMNSPTVGVALEKFCRYHHLLNDAIQPKVAAEADLVFLYWEAADPHSRSSRHVSEALLCVLNAVLHHLSGGKFTPVAVHFRHDRPRDIREHERIFNTRLEFGQARNAVVLERRYLATPVFLADPGFLESVERHAVALTHRIYLADSWADKVIRLLGRQLPGEKPALPAIARQLGVCTRSLQTRLRGEGTSFQALLDWVRKESALTYLKKPEIPLGEIAFLLGFSEQSAFIHAFKRWTGKTPKQYRNHR